MAPTQDAALLPFTTKVCQKCKLQGYLCLFKCQNVTSVVSGNLLGRYPKPDCTFLVPIWGRGLFCLQPSPCHDVWHRGHAFCLMVNRPALTSWLRACLQHLSAVLVFDPVKTILCWTSPRFFLLYIGGNCMHHRASECGYFGWHKVSVK